MGKVGGQDGACRREVDRAPQTHATSAHIASLTSNRGRCSRTASAAWRSTHAHRFGSRACPDEATGSIPVGASTTHCCSAVPVGRPEQACRGRRWRRPHQGREERRFVGLRSAQVWRVGAAPPSSDRSPIEGFSTGGSDASIRLCPSFGKPSSALYASDVRELQATADVRVRRRVSAGRARTPARSSANGTVAPISADDQSKLSAPGCTSATTGALFGLWQLAVPEGLSESQLVGEARGIVSGLGGALRGRVVARAAGDHGRRVRCGRGGDDDRGEGCALDLHVRLLLRVSAAVGGW